MDTFGSVGARKRRISNELPGKYDGSILWQCLESILSCLMVSMLLLNIHPKGDISLYNSNDDDTVNLPCANIV